MTHPLELPRSPRNLAINETCLRHRLEEGVAKRGIARPEAYVMQHEGVP